MINIAEAELADHEIEPKETTLADSSATSL